MKKDDVLEQLRGSGTLVARGRLTIDRTRAYEKMSEFQLPDPLHYVLRLIEAGHLLGTNVIHALADADEFQLDFDGVALTVDELEDLYHAALSDTYDRRTRAMRQLAIGLTAAEALEPSLVRVESYSRGHLATLEFTATADGVELRERVQTEEHDYFMDFMRIYVRERFRPGHIAEFFERVGGEGVPEEHLIRDRCRFSDRSLFVNRQGVGRGLALPDEVKQARDFDFGDFRGRVGYIPEETGYRLHLVQNGVLIRDWTQESEIGPGILGVLDVGHLRKDLSQSDFLEDHRWETLVETHIPEIVANFRLV